MNAHANISYEDQLKARYSAAKARTFPGRAVTRAEVKPASVRVSEPTNAPIPRLEVQERSHIDAFHAWQAWTGAPMTPREFFRAACFLAGYDPDLIRSRRDHKKLADVRLAIIRSIAVRYPKMSSPKIGKVVNRDHTTVLYCMGQTQRSIERNASKLREGPKFISKENKAKIIAMRMKGIPYADIAATLSVNVSSCWHVMHKYRQALRVNEPGLTASEILKRAA